MSDALPQSWATAPLAALGTWRGGGTPSKANPSYWHNGTVHWVSPKDMKRLLIDSAQDQITKKAVTESATNLIPASSVLMVTRSGILAHTFPIGINTVDVAINQDIKAWTSAGAVDPTYTAYFLKARGQHILRTCSKDGTTVSSIEFDRLTNYLVSVAPAAEQRRIVSKIDELFSRIDEGEQALARVEKLVERYRQSVLKAAVTGELTRDWRAAKKRAGEPVESGAALLARILKARRAAWETAELAKLTAKGKPPTDDRWKQKYQEPAPPDTADLPELPEGWCALRIGVVGEVQLGRQRAPAHHTGKFMRPYLRVANVFEERIDITDVMSMNFTPDEFETYALRRDDILLNEGQSKELVGRPAIYRDELPGACFTNTLVRFRACATVLPEFALLVFLHYMKSGAFQDIAKITTNIAHLGAGRFADMTFPVPPLDEQRIIVDRAQRVTGEVGALATESSGGVCRASALRQSILKAAFSGQLVPQDPHDEPAAKLLERIAAERAAVAAPHKRRARRQGV